MPGIHGAANKHLGEAHKVGATMKMRVKNPEILFDSDNIFLSGGFLHHKMIFVHCTTSFCDRFLFCGYW
jgi:hypothetical protein